MTPEVEILPRGRQTDIYPLRWSHNEGDSVSTHQPHHCLLSRLFERKSKKTSKLRVTGLCAGNSPETDEFPAQMACNAENVSIWWRHHAITQYVYYGCWCAGDTTSQVISGRRLIYFSRNMLKGISFFTTNVYAREYLRISSSPLKRIAMHTGVSWNISSSCVTLTLTPSDAYMRR